MKICPYCGAERDTPVCAGCGVRAPAVQPKEDVGYQPFLYNGYVVWAIADWSLFRCSWCFYLGDELIEVISLDRDVICKFVPEYADPMPFVWDLFEVAQGEEKVLRIQEQNCKRPAIFEIRQCTSEREEWLASLEFEDLAAEWRPL